MIKSSRAPRAASQVISGSGFAIANRIGRSAIDRTISGETQLATDRPAKTSAPRMASARVRASVSTANASLYLFMCSVRPL